MSAIPEDKRGRVSFVIAAVAIVVFGLIWRSHLLPLSPFLKKYGGGGLWALLAFLIIRFLQPRMNVVIRACFAFAFSLVVKLSQLYHAPWIDTIRGTRLGALVLGSTFNWPDIPAYAVGDHPGRCAGSRLTNPAPQESITPYFPSNTSSVQRILATTVLHEWREPRHQEFHERDVWSLFSSERWKSRRVAETD